MTSPIANTSGSRRETIATMEGRALNREPRKQAAVLAPCMSNLVASMVADVTGAERATFFLTGLIAGVVWQLLYRRDLVSRLTFMAVLVTIGVGVTLMGREDFHWNDMNTAGLLTIGILLGLIHSEQYLRWRDRVAAQRVVPRRDPRDASV